jgi:hypothetical protein
MVNNPAGTGWQLVHTAGKRRTCQQYIQYCQGLCKSLMQGSPLQNTINTTRQYHEQQLTLSVQVLHAFAVLTGARARRRSQAPQPQRKARTARDLIRR